MCEFISWIEKDKEVLFLTDKDIKALQRKQWNKDKSEMCGHGAIMFLYGLGDNDGVQKEWSNFSTPDNFPKQIVLAIKQGKMKYGVLSDFAPRQMLTAPALAKYEEVQATALAKYEEVIAPALAKYKEVIAPAWAKYKEVQATALAKYEEVIAPAWAKYEEVQATALAKYKEVEATALAKYKEVEATAWAEYDKIQATAWAEYEKIKATAFGKLFANPKNRAKNWK